MKEHLENTLIFFFFDFFFIDTFLSLLFLLFEFIRMFSFSLFVKSSQLLVDVKIRTTRKYTYSHKREKK